MHNLTSLLFDAAARCKSCLDRNLARNAEAIREVRDPAVLFHIAWRADPSQPALRGGASDFTLASRR